MKKKISLLLTIVFLITMVITACAGSPAPEPEPVKAVIPTPEPQAELSLPPEPKEIILSGAVNHRVVKGDTLSSIAAGKYGNMFYFPLIRLANISILPDPDILKVNTNLVIPDLQRNLNSAGAVEMICEDMLAFAEKYDRQGKPNPAAELRKLAAGISLE